VLEEGTNTRKEGCPRVECCAVLAETLSSISIDLWGQAWSQKCATAMYMSCDSQRPRGWIQDRADADHSSQRTTERNEEVQPWNCIRKDAACGVRADAIRHGSGVEKGNGDVQLPWLDAQSA